MIRYSEYYIVHFAGSDRVNEQNIHAQERRAAVIYQTLE